MPRLDCVEITEIRAQQEGEESRGQAEGSPEPRVLFPALLLHPQDNPVFWGMPAGRSVDFGRQGMSVELFVRAALARVTTLLAVSSPGGRAAKKAGRRLFSQQDPRRQSFPALLLCSCAAKLFSWCSRRCLHPDSCFPTLSAPVQPAKHVNFSAEVL